MRVILVSNTLIVYITICLNKITKPISYKKIGQFAGKWVVIDPTKKTVIAVVETFKDIAHIVTHSAKAKIAPVGKAPFSYLVPRKDEGPYILWIKLP